MRLIINKLNEINCNKFGENDGISYFSNLMVDSDSYVPMKEEKLSLDLMQYETVKFYLFRLGTGGGGLFTNKRRNSTGHIVDRVAGADRWVEIKLRKEDSGTGFLIYVDGVFFARFKATKPKSR